VKPVIGITAAPSEEARAYKTGLRYVQAVAAAGGLPLLLPAQGGAPEAQAFAARIDGLLIPGGGDVAPLLYDEEPHPLTGVTRQGADLFEFSLIRAAHRRGLPILGVCRGIQVINVCFGGTLWQDIPSQLPESVCHMQSTQTRGERTHTIRITEGSLLHRLLGARQTAVNSFHHQAVRKTAPGLTVCACAEDGVIEALETPGGILAVQWHPEELCVPHPDQARLFAWLVESAGFPRKSLPNGEKRY